MAWKTSVVKNSAVEQGEQLLVSQCRSPLVAARSADSGWIVSVFRLGLSFRCPVGRITVSFGVEVKGVRGSVFGMLCNSF